MKSLLGFLRKIFTVGCVIFSAVTVGYAILFYIIYADSEDKLIDLDRIILFFCFGLLVGIAHAIWKLPVMKTAVRFLLHLVITLFAFCACLLLPLDLKPSGYVVGIVFFLVLYLLTFGLYSLIAEKHKRKKEALADYEKQFGKSQK